MIYFIFLLMLIVHQTTPKRYEYRKLWGMGNNEYGQLGLENVSFVSDPMEIPFEMVFEKYHGGTQENRTVSRISVSKYHTLILTEPDQALYVTGRNHYGQLGLGHLQDQYGFVRLSYQSSGIDFNEFGFFGVGGMQFSSANSSEVLCVASMCAMHESSIVLSCSNQLLAMGRNEYGQLGIGDLQRRDGSAPQHTLPRSVFHLGQLRHKKISSLVCAKQSAYMLTKDHRLYGMGRNDHFQLGLGHQVNQYLPTLITSLSIKQIAVGKHETFAVTLDGRLLSWGRGWEGQMANLDTYSQGVPTRISFFDQSTVQAVFAGSGFAMALSEGVNGVNLHAWGDNFQGRLGLAGSRIMEPTSVSWNYLKDVAQFGGGYMFPVIIAADGMVYMSWNESITEEASSEFIEWPFDEKISSFISSPEHSFILEGFECGNRIDSDPLVCFGHGECNTRENYCHCEPGYSNFNDPNECKVCPAGTYSVFSNDGRLSTCSPCPVTTFSPVLGASDPSTCENCPAGTITDGNGKNSSSQCEPCPPGFFGLVDIETDTAVCEPCPRGTYSFEGAATSIDTCRPCPQGTYSSIEAATDVSQCKLCPFGTYSVIEGGTNITVCQSCPSGTFNPINGSSSPSACAPCPLGWYNPDLAAEYCNQCPEGHVTDSVGKESFFDCQACIEGTFASLEVQTTLTYCPVCPVGSFANATAMTSCIRCPDGHITLQNATESEDDCLPCQPGTYSTDNAECIPCPAGYYNNLLGASSFDACRPCRPGTFSEIIGAESVLNCTLCPAGTFSTILGSDSDSCDLCPMNTFSFDGSDVCLGCPLGSDAIFNPETNMTSCVPCRAGTRILIVNDTTICDPCPYGTYSDSDSMVQCFQCPPGHITMSKASNSSEDCVPCQAGSYALREMDFNACELCPEGTFSDVIAGANESVCQPCPAGTYSPNLGVSKSMDCLSCPAGYASNNIGQTSISTCQICPLQTYSPQRSPECIDCEPGTVTSGVGMTNVTDCLPCFIGTYSITLNGTSECIPCPRGTYSTTPLATSNATCIPCARGKYSDELGASDPNVCLGCPSGYFQPVLGANSIDMCLECPEGTYSGDPAVSQCNFCPGGKTTVATRNTGAGACIECPAGTYSLQVGYSQICVDCPAGTFSPFANQNDSSACIPCVPGTYSSTVGGGEDSCVPCPPGSFSAEVGATSSEACELCPVKTYSDQFGSSACINCGFGTIPDAPGKNSSADCRTCGSGKFLQFFNNTPICESCPPGTYSFVPNAVNSSVCQLCPQGTFNPEFGSSDISECLPCPLGTFNPYIGATNISFCFSCPSESYTPDVAQAQCASCPNGTLTCINDNTDPCENSLGNEGLHRCIECEPGMYFEESDPHELVRCERCPPGYYSSNNDPNYCGYDDDGDELCSRVSPHYRIGIASCVPCPAGTYFRLSGDSPAGSVSVCIPCPASFYSNETATLQENCQPCPAGTWASQASSQCIPCEGGTFSDKPAGQRVSPNDCQSCPIGYFSNRGESSCTACPKGTWSDQIEANNITACFPCRAGTASDAFGATSEDSCQSCPIGFYTDSSGSTECHPCPAGTFQPLNGGTTCRLCSPGFYSNGQSSHCQPCPPGTANPNPGATGISMCRPCPENTYSPSYNSSACLACGDNFRCPIGASARVDTSVFSDFFSRPIVNITRIVLRTEELRQSGEITKSSLIPLFLLFVFGILLVTLVLGIIRKGRKNPFYMFHKFDWLYDMDHPCLENKPRIKKRNKLGGFCSLVALTSVMVVFILLTTDVFLNNIRLVEQFEMVEPEGASEDTIDVTMGKYVVKTILVGNFEERCSSDNIRLSWNGLLSRDSSISEDNYCERQENWENEDQVINVPVCVCSLVCESCSLDGIVQNIDFFFENVHSSFIYYELSVPHYSVDQAGNRQQFVISGNVLASGNSVFFGEFTSPVNLFFSIFQSRYLESPNVLVSLFSNEKKELEGLTSQLLSISTTGATSNPERMSDLLSQPDPKELGIRVRFNLEVSTFVFVREEQQILTAAAYVAQLAALAGAVIGLARGTLKQIETNKKRVKKVSRRIKSKLRKKKSVPDAQREEINVDTHEPIREKTIKRVDPWIYIPENTKNMVTDEHPEELARVDDLSNITLSFDEGSSPRKDKEESQDSNDVRPIDAKTDSLGKSLTLSEKSVLSQDDVYSLKKSEAKISSVEETTFDKPIEAKVPSAEKTSESKSKSPNMSQSPSEKQGKIEKANPPSDKNTPKKVSKKSKKTKKATKPKKKKAKIEKSPYQRPYPMLTNIVPQKEAADENMSEVSEVTEDLSDVSVNTDDDMF